MHLLLLFRDSDIDTDSEIELEDNDLIVAMSTDSGSDNMTTTKWECSDFMRILMRIFMRIFMGILKFGQIFNFHKGAWLFVC